MVPFMMVLRTCKFRWVPQFHFHGTNLDFKNGISLNTSYNTGSAPTYLVQVFQIHFVSNHRINDIWKLWSVSELGHSLHSLNEIRNCKMNLAKIFMKQIIALWGTKSNTYPCDNGLALRWCHFFYGFPSHQKLQEDNPKSIDITFLSQLT